MNAPLKLAALQDAALREMTRELLRDVVRDLVRTQRMAPADARTLLQQLQGSQFALARDVLEQAYARRTGAAASGWPRTTVALLKQADALHANWTRARKLDAVARVIDGAAEQPDVALERLNKLMESWGPALAGLPPREDPPVIARAPAPAATPTSAVPAAHAPHGLNGASAASAAGASSASSAAHAPTAPAPLQTPAAQRYADPQALTRATELAETLRTSAEAWKQVALRAVRLLEHACGPGTPAASKLHDYAAQHAPLAIDESDKIVARFIDAVSAIDRQFDEQRRIREGLARLLGLLTANVQTLAPEEAWLAGQLEPIRALLGGPLDAQQIASAEQTVSAVIERQSDARKSLQEAKFAIKELLATLVERIGAMGASTGRYYEQVSAHQRELAQANDLASLSQVIRGLLDDTQSVRGDVERSQQELADARREVEAYERRVEQLESELAQISTLVQKDPLTHALNRRGFAESFHMETARALRYDAPLALAMLDLDNFKKLNDILGHAVGDRALVHLAETLQSLLRPTDLFARLGGEEFAVLFPATRADEAARAVERLQRELAHKPLECEAGNTVLTFSAGVAGWRDGEALEALLVRADEAMYAAKRAGKNRVVKAA